MKEGVIQNRLELRRLITAAFCKAAPNRLNFKREDGKRVVKLRKDISLTFQYHPTKREIYVTYTTVDPQPRYLVSYSPCARRVDIMVILDKAMSGIMFDRLYLTREISFYQTRSLGESIRTDFREVIEGDDKEKAEAAKAIFEVRKMRYKTTISHLDGKIPVFIG